MPPPSPAPPSPSLSRWREKSTRGFQSHSVKRSSLAQSTFLIFVCTPKIVSKNAARKKSRARQVKKRKRGLFCFPPSVCNQKWISSLFPLIALFFSNLDSIAQRTEADFPSFLPISHLFARIDFFLLPTFFHVKMQWEKKAFSGTVPSPFFLNRGFFLFSHSSLSLSFRVLPEE